MKYSIDKQQYRVVVASGDFVRLECKTCHNVFDVRPGDAHIKNGAPFCPQCKPPQCAGELVGAVKFAQYLQAAGANHDRSEVWPHE